MSFIQKLIRKNPYLRPANQLGCHLSFIEYDKDVLLAIQDKHKHEYVWYHDQLSEVTGTQVNENIFHYKILPNSFIRDEPYLNIISANIKNEIPLLENVRFDYQFVKIDGPYNLEIHIDRGRNRVIFLPLTDDSAPTDFYRNNKKIKSFDHTSALLLSVDVPHGSSISSTKITFQIGFNYENWNELLDYCVCRQLI